MTYLGQIEQKIAQLVDLNFLGLTFEGLNDLIIRAWNINENGYNPDEWRGSILKR